MTTILIDTNECVVAHEASTAKRHNTKSSWMPDFLKLRQPVLLDLEEDINSIGIVLTKDLPRCP